MNSVSGIINTLSSSEIDEFIFFLKRKNKRHDTKNIQLFQLLKTDDKNEITAHENKPALYALRKRLHQNLIEFIANKRFESDTSEERDILKLLIASRVFFEQEQYKTAFKVLSKAEEKALKIERFNLLNEIYHTHIQYAYLDKKTPFSQLTEKYQSNQRKFLQEEQLNLAYASLRIALSKIKEGAEVFDFQETIRNTIAQYDISLKEILTFKSLYQILFIANEYAALRNNYYEIERFFQKSYDFIVSRKELTDKHLFYHIQIVYFMANMLFRNKRFDESKLYLDKMEAEMRKQDGIYFQQFCNQLVLLRSLNENYSGNFVQAIALLEDTLAKNGSEIAEVSDLKLGLAVFSFQQHNFKKVQQILKEFHHSDAWYEKKQGMEWAIKKNLMEILLHAELDNDDYALSRTTSFKRRYKKYLIQVKEERVLVFLSLVEKYLQAPDYFKSGAFKNQLEKSFQWKSHQEEDIFVMSFYAWLKAKIEKKNIYEVTLELVKMP